MDVPLPGAKFAAGCPECDRLRLNWVTEMAHYTSLMRSLIAKTCKSLDQVRETRTQFQTAHSRMRDCWVLFELHRRHECQDTISETSPTRLYVEVSEMRLKGTPKPKAGQRRQAELQQLAAEGMPIVFHSRWHASIGPLHIWTHSGRWSCAATKRAGKLRSTSMRDLVLCEFIEVDPGWIEGEIAS